MNVRPLGSAILLLLLGGAANAAAPAQSLAIKLQDSSVDPSLTHMRMVIDHDTLKPGRVTFEATNESKGLVHEVIVVRDKGVKELPYDAKKNVVIEKRIQHLGELRGRRLCMLKAPKMCVAPDWLSTILDEGHFGPSEQFFGSVATDSKASRVVLPVFFGQTDACLTSKRSFDTMCELNPQVAKDLTVIASSPVMVVTFYIFHRNYHGLSRERFAKVYSDLPNSAAGRQLATLFQFENLVVKDIACLAPALGVLAAAERARGKSGVGGRKG